MSYKIRHLVPPLIEDTNYSNLLHFLLIYNALALISRLGQERLN